MKDSREIKRIILAFENYTIISRIKIIYNLYYKFDY